MTEITDVESLLKGLQKKFPIYLSIKNETFYSIVKSGLPTMVKEKNIGHFQGIFFASFIRGDLKTLKLIYEPSIVYRNKIENIFFPIMKHIFVL